MAPAASVSQTQAPSLPKLKRHVPGPIQTNGIISSSPSPSMSANRHLPSAKNPPGSATSNGGAHSSGPRSANRARRDTSAQLLGRGQRVSSALKSGSLLGELQMAAQPAPYIKTDAYILKKYRGSKPSLIIHLHPTHFRFEAQEGSFSYKSPMKTMIEHLRKRIIPAEMMWFFTKIDAQFFEGCMIVQVYDHKSGSGSGSGSSNKAKDGDNLPLKHSIHNYTKFVTPSPWVPFHTEEPSTGNSADGKGKSSAQIDKENMPAPSLSNSNKKPPVSTIVLHPTPHSVFLDTAEKFNTPDLQGEASNVPSSATLAQPPTPGLASTSIAPPAKRQKRAKTEWDGGNVNQAMSQIMLATTAPLVLDPVSSAAESAALLEALRHPMHSEKPPLPKTRKRTVAEMAADEAAAADQERYMLVMDERLGPRLGQAAGADGDSQIAGFEPRFERFKTLENIKAQRANAKRQEEIHRAEASRKDQQDRERERLKQEADKREAEKHRQQAQRNQMQQQQQQEAHRRAQMAQQSQQSPQPVQNGQHAHPNGNLQSGMPSQPQRFHQQQQAAQAQHASSPVVRTATPHSNSSPIVNGVQMQVSNSGMGAAGSPPRSGSVVHQLSGHAMVAQRSQQSHAGTPRMPSATPNSQTPHNRPMSATPRINQASPGSMGQAHQMNPQGMATFNINGIPTQMTQAQITEFQNNRMRMAYQNQLARQQMNGSAMVNGQQINPQQQQHFLQQQQLRQQMTAAQNGSSMAPQQISAAVHQQYQEHVQRGMQQPQHNPQAGMMNGNPNGAGPNMQQLQALQQRQQFQQMQMMQQQQQQQGPQQLSMQQQQQQQMWQQEIAKRTQNLFNQQMAKFAIQFPNGVPEEMIMQTKQQCQQHANAQLMRTMQQNRARQQQQQQQQQAGGMPQMMPNGMGMQRPQGM